MQTRRGASEAMRLRAIANPPREPHAWHPNYVHACHEKKWGLQLRHRRGEQKGMRLTFLCNSRHHRGPCRDTWSRRLRGRLLDERSMMRRCDPKHAAFWTLTLDHRVRSHGREDANREIGRLWRKLYARIVDWCRRNDLGAPAFFWIREAHRDGFPHLHLLVVHAELAKVLRERDTELEAVTEVRGSDRTIAPIWLRDMAVGCGFGGRFDASLARSLDAIASYAAKVTASIDDAEITAADASLAGELTKGSQVPELMPRHCRSYGASRGFMPPRAKSADWTGWLEDEDGRTMGTRPKNYDDAERRWIDRAKRCDAAGPGFDPRNPMAFWPDAASMLRFALGEAPGLEVAKTYRMRPDDGWKFERNAKAHPEEQAIADACGAPGLAIDDNPAAAAARALRAAALARERNRPGAANDAGFELEPWGF